MADDFTLTTSRIQEAVRRALGEDFKFDYSKSDRLFDQWLAATINEDQQA